MGTYRLRPSGGTYSLKYYPGMSEIFGPAGDIRREALIERLVARRRAPGEETVASGCAGAEANFTPPTNSRISVQINWPNEPDDDPTDDAPRYSEQSAVVREVRVTNPDDAEQYVDILARNASKLRRDDGTEFWIDWLQDLSDQPRAE